MFLKKEFIIESKPERTKIDTYKLQKVANHINKSTTDGFTQEEIETLLNWIVENARQNIEKYLGQDITNEDLAGLCLFAQISSLLPLEGKFKETYNYTTDFKYVIDELRHSFGTITFPIKVNKNIEKKQYLIDVTMRQFFKTIMCENPKYKSDGTFVMDPGYFLCTRSRRTKESLELARQLLKKGYIELTDKNLKLYIDSFIYSSIYRTNQSHLHDIKNLDMEFYRKGISKGTPFIQEFDSEFLEKYNCITKMPYIDYKQKVIKIGSYNGRSRNI